MKGAALSGKPAANPAIAWVLQLPRLPLMELAAIGAVFSTYLVPYLIGGVGLSHIFGVALIAFGAQRSVRSTGRDATATFFLFLGILFMSMASGYALGPKERFWTEAVKTAIVFLVAFFAGITISPQRLRAILRPGPWLCLVLVCLIFAIVGNPFSLDGRLAMEGFISPNVLGFLIVLNMAVILCADTRKVWDWGLLVILAVAMLACFSRSALLASLALLLVRIGWRWGATLIGGVGMTLAIVFSNNKVIERMLVIEDVMTTGGSGRSNLWQYLLTRLWHTPEAWAFGFGPGSVERVLTLLSKEEAAHSLVLGSLYYWGFAGMLFVGICALMAVRGVWNAPPSRERMLAWDVVLIFITNGMVDESYDGSQINVVSALFIAMVVGVIVQSRKERGSARMGVNLAAPDGAV